MIKLVTTTKDPELLLAKIVELQMEKDLPGSNNLKLTIIDGTPVIIRANSDIGDIGIYFPVGCVIDKGFLGANNLFKSSRLNENPNVGGGYFQPDGKVRPLKLCTVVSHGFWLSLDSLKKWQSWVSVKDLEQFKGHQFDTIVGNGFDDILKLCQPSKKKKIFAIDRNRKFNDPSAMVSKRSRKKVKAGQVVRFKSDDKLLTITVGSAKILIEVVPLKKVTIMERIKRFFGNHWLSVVD